MSASKQAERKKPDAAEWTRQLVQNNPSDLAGWAELEQSDIEERLDAFQRETLLWAERQKIEASKTCRQVRGDGKYGCNCPVDGIIPGCHCVCHD